MKKLLMFAVFFAFVSSSYCQTALEKAVKDINMSVKLPPFLKASVNDSLIYVAPLAEKDTIPTLKQSSNRAPSFGNQALRTYFGELHSIIRPDNGDYVVFVYVGEGVRGASGQSVSGYYDRIKHDFRYGKPMTASTKADRADLDLMLTHYPQQKAREMFNADWMVMYPFSLRGEVYEGKYSRCRAVLAAKEGAFVVFYFMMTKETGYFDNCLNDFKRAFWYDDLK